MATCDPNTLVGQAKCIECTIPKGMRDSVMIWLLCQIAAGGTGGGGGIQVFAGSGPPTTQTPANGAGVYYDYTNFVTYNWNPITLAWS